MTPEEKSLLARAKAHRRDEIARALEALDRIRASHPAAARPEDLPPVLREEARAALAVLDRARGGSFGKMGLLMALLTMLALAVLALAPFTAYRIEPATDGFARCRVSRRLLGLVPLGSDDFASVARATYETHVEASQSSSEGKSTTIRTTVEALRLVDPEERVLHARADSHLLGASLADIARDVNAFVEAPAGQPLVRWNVAWPPFLFSSLFLLIAGTELMARLGQTLQRLGGTSPGARRIVFFWGPTLVIGAVLAASWLLAFLGAAPPPWLVGALGLGA